LYTPERGYPFLLVWSSGTTSLDIGLGKHTLTLFPRFHVDADMSRYYGQNNDYRSMHAFVEDDITMHYDFVSFDSIVTLKVQFMVKIGMGHSLEDVVFDPMDIGYGFDPQLRVHIRYGNAECGLQHHCYHEVDRKHFKTVLYNKLFAGFSSPNFHPLDFVNGAATQQPWHCSRNLAWLARWGFFMREFFDRVRPSSISYHTNAVQELNAEAVASLYRLGSLLLCLRTKARLGSWDDYNLDEPLWKPMTYWQLQCIPEIHTPLGNRNACVFLSYTRDELPRFRDHRDNSFQPRFSMDRLWELGLRLSL
jgi:hypothetical protein